MDINNYYAEENEKPLDKIAYNGGFCGIFSTICCIGDSLSSGEFETVGKDGTHHYYDMYEYSWGQYIARMTGSKVYNFSRGGMTAKQYCESFADDNGFWAAKFASQAYIIALGANDKWQEYETGSVADVDLDDHINNKKTFAGYYGEIIQRVKKISPDAKLFFVTEPKHSSDNEKAVLRKQEEREVLYGFTKLFEGSYVIDLYKYGPVYDDKFKYNFYLNGHMTPSGYMLSANMIASYIDYIIRSNPRDFALAGLIGTGIDPGVTDTIERNLYEDRKLF